MTPRRVLVAHNRVDIDDDPSTRDVLAQVEWVVSGLEALGLEHETLSIAEPESLAELGPPRGTVVFNLVESPPGRPRFQVEVAMAWEKLGVPFTGSGSAAIWLTTDKLETRQRMTDAGLAVAPGTELDPDAPEDLDRVPPPWILKPAREDASLGLEDGAVTSDPVAASRRARSLVARFGPPVLAEHLLPGREFNLSVLAGPDGPQVLPAAEMVYVDFPENMPRVLGFQAKWHDDSFASRHTVRRFVTAEGEDRELVRTLRRIAGTAWEVSGVAGYARVDLRLDERGEPCVLEVNANPCLSGDAGFVAAAAEAGLDAGEVVRRVLAEAGGME
jgi:D-alanine-D-alanine ligase